jgi:uncharacterized protein with NRDE domain
MCTLALYFRVFEDYPVVVAANRDEHYDRPSLPPVLLSENPRIFGGKDLRVGGTWLGVNEHNVLAAILNRRIDACEIPVAEPRSRGLLCLDMLMFRNAMEARTSLPREEQYEYQPFNLLIADSTTAWAAFNVGKEIRVVQLSPGLHVFSSTSRHDERSEKKERAYLLFSGLVAGLTNSEPDLSEWVRLFKGVLADHTGSNGTGDRRDAICVHGNVSGTVSSSIIIYSKRESMFRIFFSGGPPCRNEFTETNSLRARG